MIIGVVGAVVGRVTRIADHPRAHSIWLADVDLADGELPRQVVFGGDLELMVDDLVPVAPPGACVTVLDLASSTTWTRRMRVRSFRGERSYGMFCSLDELGWLWGGPNEVAILHSVLPGYRLDRLPRDERCQVVWDWERAWRISRTEPLVSFDNQITQLSVVHQHVDSGSRSVAYS